MLFNKEYESLHYLEIAETYRNIFSHQSSSIGKRKKRKKIAGSRFRSRFYPSEHLLQHLLAEETNKKIPTWFEVSKDNNFYLKYTDLISAAQNDEIRIEGCNKNGEREKVLIREFEALLDRPPRHAKRVFVSYSHRNTHWLGRLRAHLSGLRRSNEIETWTDQEILPGDLWDKKIKDALAEADVFILLLSADFIDSNYIWDIELKTAIERFKKDQKMVITILVEPLDIGGLPGVTEDTDSTGKVKNLKIQDFEIVPKDNNGYLKAVSLWENHEEALATVAQRIRAAIVNKNAES